MLRDDKVRAFYRLGRELLRELIEGDLRQQNEEVAEELEEEDWEREDLLEWCPGCQRFQDRNRHHHPAVTTMTKKERQKPKPVK
ncbi:hypothetical protein L596_025992 [Steinernema carpocapsae]|uniref:Uncharacterized protein n=1 Tax=Steinernema carpocapsae TaxID=34508 RepID=A0A4U5M034_STECR|nr:hypothetical protein L596_025992 [Steinernema carpocapsae]